MENIDLGQAVEVPLRVFIDQNGKFYKGDKATNDSDMESNHPTEDMLAVLTDSPMRREEMLAKIINLGNKRITAVIAPELLNE